MTARVEPSILVADDWQDYRLLDSGAGRKLEQVGPYRFVRPEPQALWLPRSPESEWDGAHAVFAPSGSGDDDAGKWRFNAPLPETWPMAWDGMRFISRPTPFRHLAFFPEHSVHWRYAVGVLTSMKSEQPPEVLNLFGYTGLASLACARAGARVTHVDASKKAIGFARDNQSAGGLNDAAIRWICDDALVFVRREVRRGRRYDGIILDPPKFGRGPDGEVWRLEEHLPGLAADCRRLLDKDSRFLFLTVYAVRMSSLALGGLLAELFADLPGTVEHGELAVREEGSGARLLPTAIFARWANPG